MSNCWIFPWELLTCKRARQSSRCEGGGESQTSRWFQRKLFLRRSPEAKFKESLRELLQGMAEGEEGQTCRGKGIDKLFPGGGLRCEGLPPPSLSPNPRRWHSGARQGRKGTRQALLIKSSCCTILVGWRGSVPFLGGWGSLLFRGSCQKGPE